MPFIDTNELTVKEPLPGWKGRYFNSSSMTFGYYSVAAGATIHEHSHPNEEVWHVIQGRLEVTIGGAGPNPRARCVGGRPPKPGGPLRGPNHRPPILLGYTPRPSRG